MATATDEQKDVVEEAKAEQKEAQSKLSAVRAQAKMAKSAYNKARSAEKDKEGDELKQAKAATKEAKKAADDAEKEVGVAEKALETAKKGVADAKKADKERKAEERANRPKAVPMTLSQRRAILKLAEGPQTPTTEFNKLPYEHLVKHELAQSETVSVAGPPIKETVGEGDEKQTVEKPGPNIEATRYSLTEAGKERVSSINPKWRDWKPERGASASDEPDAEAGSDNGDTPVEEPVAAS